jgi:hypothetical protein
VRPIRSYVVASWALALAASGWLLSRGLRAASLRLRDYPWDGKVDWIVARAFWAGVNPYSRESLRALDLLSLGHPPTTAFWFLPLAGLSMAGFSVAVGWTMIALLLIGFLLLTFELRVPAAAPTALLLFAWTLQTPWMRYHLSLAQISQLIAFLYVLTWVAARRGHEVLAGLALGAACTLKLYPGLVGLFFLLAGRWKVVVAAIGAYLLVAAIMTWRLGVHAWVDYFAVEGKVSDQWTANHHNASLYGIFHRWLGPPCGQPHGPTLGSATTIAIVITVALVVVFWRLARARVAERRGFDLAFALFAALSAFANPFTFEHYDAILMPSLVIAGAYVLFGWREGIDRRWLLVAGLALASTLLMMSPEKHMTDHYCGLIGKQPGAHAWFHFYEVVNWLPWVVVLGVLAWQTTWPRTRRP